MTPQEFISKWQRVTLSERSACQQHFLDLCDLLKQPKPAAADPEGAWYTFERGLKDNEGDQGWADVWMKNHFGWEYKGKHKDLSKAYQQLQRYREALENPPLLVVCDMDRFEIHTNFTGSVKNVHAFSLAELSEPKNLEVLRKAFTDPQSLRPGETTATITEKAAIELAGLSDGMRDRGIEPHKAAHFLMKLVFCMFAEDIALLVPPAQNQKPKKLFREVLQGSKDNPERLSKMLKELFKSMAKGGMFGTDDILYFNGGLFADAETITLTPEEIRILVRVNDFDWSDVEPSIFGTLFERTLDPSKRSQIGAHYTSREDIEMLLQPVMMAPLRREWSEVRNKADALFEKLRIKAMKLKKEQREQTKRKNSKEFRELSKLFEGFLHRLATVTVLDPACGSGNFLYVALHLLLDLEKEVISYAGPLGLGLFPQVRPTQLAGLEINEYAQQLAQVVIWIGFLQWMHHNGFQPPQNPVLDPIDSIRRTDAIIDRSNSEKPVEPDWPDATFIVGNPPFLHGSKMRAELGDAYVEDLFPLYSGRVAGFADLCCYWFEKSYAQIKAGKAERAGLLATQGIRGGASREVLQRIVTNGGIFFAESDREWLLDGASVHVSMIGFDDGTEKNRILNGKAVSEIHSNLDAGADVTRAKRLKGQNSLWCYGSQEKADFGINSELSESMLANPNATGRPNSDVLRPSLGGKKILQRNSDAWVIDFADERDIEIASQYEEPFEHVRKTVFQQRCNHPEPRQQKFWWLHARPSPEYRKAIASGERCLVTPASSKHRIFVWIDSAILVDHAAIVFTVADDSFFGVLQSRIHEVWARAPGNGTQVRERESGFRYTPKSCFETFPFPVLSESLKETISKCASDLNWKRNAWLNPPEWTRPDMLTFVGSIDGPWRNYIANHDERGLGEVQYPRLVPKTDEFAGKLAKRTLTSLYNERPTWLDLAHKKLDEAVFAAYGWDPGISDDELLTKLLQLNLERAAAEEAE